MPTYSRKQLANGDVIDLPAFNEEVIKDGEKVLFFACGGGGYGRPEDRDPGLVLRLINRDWLTVDKALQIYGVQIGFDEKSRLMYK